MSVVVVDINSTTLKKTGNMTRTPEKEARMLPLAEYYKIAKRVILHCASPSLAKSMVKDEDAMSFMVEALIRGTMRWEPDGGRTLRSYLNQCGRWAIPRWILNKKQADKRKNLSLDMEMDDDGNNMHNFVADPFAVGNVEEIIDKPYLNDTQKECLRLRFVNNMTFRDIGTALNKTGQRIKQIVNKAIEKLRNEHIES